METRQRLNDVTTLSSVLLTTEAAVFHSRSLKLQSIKPHPSSLSLRFLMKILTVGVLLLSTVGFENWSRSKTVTADLNLLQNPITNKIFHHNRTTPAVMAMAIHEHKKHQAKNTEKMGSAQKDTGHSTKPILQSRPPSPQYLNINNYFKTAINILSMGLGAVTTPKSVQSWRPSRPIPFLSNTHSEVSSQEPIFHPLSVLKTQLTNVSQDGDRGNGSSSMEGRSALEFEPLFESSYDKNGTMPGNRGKNMETSLFEKFEDWEDPLAQQSSVQNSFTVVDPPNLKSGLNVAQRPKPPWSSSSGSDLPHPNHKNVNYWPNKLNSYYGIQKSPGYISRPVNIGPSPNFGGGHHNHGSSSIGSGPHYEDDHYDIETASSENDAVTHEKSTMIERVSLFYSNYKILAWAIIIVAAAVVAVGAVVALYYNNPPTEVVTARKELTRAMNDPRLLTFIESLLDNRIYDQNHFDPVRRRSTNRETF